MDKTDNLIMTKQETKNLSKLLFSADDNTVLNALSEIRKVGNVEHLPAIIDLLCSPASGKIKTEIISILNQLKDTNSVKIIAEAISNENYSDIQQILLASCWNSGLNYSSYTTIFTEIFIKSPFMVAFEAYTIIDSTDGILFSAKEISASEALLKENYASAEDDKKPLYESLLLIFEDKKTELLNHKAN